MNDSVPLEDLFPLTEKNKKTFCVVARNSINKEFRCRYHDFRQQRHCNYCPTGRSIRPDAKFPDFEWDGVIPVTWMK